MSQNRNLFDAIAVQGTDDGFRPRVTKEFQPTSARAGSPEKIAILRWRMERGLPLWHQADCPGFRIESNDEIPGFGRPSDNPR